MSVAGVRATRVRLFQFWTGAWIADCDLDADTAASVPSGPVTLSVGGQSLQGTVDARGSGSFGGKASVRVVAGAAAWDMPVARQDWQNDTGVLSTTVYQATASQVGETVNDLAPAQLGNHFVRPAGPASEVFGALPWWVDFTGVTNVGTRPAATADASLLVRDFEPTVQRVVFSCDTLVLPNTTLSDARFNGASYVVRDVEHVFDEQGNVGSAWCSGAPAPRLFGALGNMIKAVAGLALLRGARYKLVQYNGTRLELQAVNPTEGLPDLVPVYSWAGVPGFSAQMQPGAVVFVVFDFTTPGQPQPILCAYDQTGLPVKASYDAQAELDLGPSALAVNIAGGSAGYAACAAPIVTFLGALQTWSVAVAGALSSAGFPIATAQANLTAAITNASSTTPAKKTQIA